MPSQNALPTARHQSTGLILAAACALWMTGFVFWFSGFELPNNHVPRSLLWERSAFDLLDLVDPPTRAGEASWSWFFLLQRIPFLLIAVLIWFGAWGHGALILRWLRVPLRGVERLYFALCVGLSSVSLTMLCIGLLGAMHRWLLVVLLVGPAVVEVLFARRDPFPSGSSASDRSPKSTAYSALARWCWVPALVFLIPFVVTQLLGAMSPQTDFDVVEYHLGGPKEWFQRGQIVRLPHNVYTSFPFLSEMLVLAGMVIYGDWDWGALAGQAAIAGLAPLTALGLFTAGRRWFSTECGWLAALVYLTSPWTYRISIIAYAEGGLACYLFAALYAVLLFREHCVNPAAESSKGSIPFAAIAGLMAGSGMACKYTGLVSVVIPCSLLLMRIAFRKIANSGTRQAVTVLLCFSLGIIAAIGPWLLKNAVETGNPVYPLAVRLLGGVDRDPELDAKWVKAHAAKQYSSWASRWNDLPVKVTDVIANNDWHGPLMFALSPLSLLWLRRKFWARSTKENGSSLQSGLVAIVWLYVAWQFFTWWFLTHHIDRFYVPMFSAVALLAGIGACWWQAISDGEFDRTIRAIWRVFVGIVIAVSLLYNTEIMIQQGISGFNAGRLDLNTAREIAVGRASRMRWLNDEYESGRLPQSTKVLCVGEVQMFHARYPYLYNTVFNHCLFEQICADPKEPQQMRSADEIRAELKRLGITLIDVNWMDILRYREPGNYGFTDFVRPDRFDELQRTGILGPPLKLPREMTLDPLSDDLRKRLEEWGPSLITNFEGKPYYIKGQIYPVVTDN